MYVLAHLSYQVIPSPRWVTLFPLCCLYLGLAVFTLAVAPVLRGTSQLAFLGMATLHPQLLMWGNSLRWYPWWTGLALVVLIVALQPGAHDRADLKYGRSLTAGVLAGCLFYLNHVTILFCLALVAAMLIRYGWSAWKHCLMMAGSAILLSVPQLHASLTVHVGASKGQRSSVVMATARLVQGLFTSEAYLPWHPLAILALLLFVTLAIASARRRLGFGGRPAVGASEVGSRGLRSILGFTLTFFMLLAMSGLGGKPRNALILIPALAPATALAVGGLRTRAARYAVLSLLMIWSGVGIAHLLRREGLAKASMNNRPDQVLRFIEKSRGNACSVVVTYDPTLTFYLTERRLNGQLILTYTQNRMYREAAPFEAAACPALRLYVVSSYPGGFGVDQQLLPRMVQRASRWIQGTARSDAFSHDPSAHLERRLWFLGGGSALPDDRYVVTSGAIASSGLRSLEQGLPEFVMADGHSEARQ